MYVLEGEVVLVTDEGEQVLRAGDCAGYPGGSRNGHHLQNRGGAPARYIEIGNRDPDDAPFYPDDDLAWVEDAQGGRYTHKDGRPY